MISKTEQINFIMDHFNFNKVRDVMESMDWFWAFTEYGASKVPSVQDLRNCARGLLENVSRGGYCATGGFQVFDQEGILTLLFSVEACDAGDIIN